MSWRSSPTGPSSMVLSISVTSEAMSKRSTLRSQVDSVFEVGWDSNEKLRFTPLVARILSSGGGDDIVWTKTRIAYRRPVNCFCNAVMNKRKIEILNITKGHNKQHLRKDVLDLCLSRTTRYRDIWVDFFFKYNNLKYQWKAFIKQNLMERVVYSGPDFDQAVILFKFKIVLLLLTSTLRLSLSASGAKRARSEDKEMISWSAPPACSILQSSWSLQQIHKYLWFY